MQGNTRGMYGSGCKVTGECRGMLGECKVVGAKCQGNAGEFQGNVLEWVQCAMGMQGNAG